MTREEIKAKLEQAKTNKVLPENMRALSIAKYEKMLADLPEDKPAKAEPKKAEKTGYKYKLGDMYRSDFDYEGMMEYAKKANDKTPLKDLKKLADSMEDVNYHTEAKKIFALIDKKNKASKDEPKKSEPKKAESKEPDYDCDKLIAEVKAKREKAKKSAEKSAKKPEVTKAKERIEKTYEAIETKVEKGEFTKTQLQKLIEETREYLKRLEKAIKSL